MPTDRFNRLWSNAAPSVRAVLARHAWHRSPDDREDLLQDVRIRAYAAHGLSDTNKFTPWCCRIAYRICLDALRKDSRSVSVAPKDATDLLDLAVCARPTPLELLLSEERRLEIFEPFRHLPEANLEAAQLRADGLSYEEIGDIQHVSAGAVRARIHRLRAVAKGLYHGAPAES